MFSRVLLTDSDGLKTTKKRGIVQFMFSGAGNHESPALTVELQAPQLFAVSLYPVGQWAVCPLSSGTARTRCLVL